MPLNDSYIGNPLPATRIYEVSREKIREFAIAVGEPSPLCQDSEAARAVGYRDVIAPPTFVIGLALEAQHQLFTDPEFGLDYERMVHGSQRFTHHRPLTAGERLTATPTVESIQRRAGNEMFTVRVDLVTTEGELVSQGSAMLVVRGDGNEAA